MDGAARGKEKIGGGSEWGEGEVKMKDAAMVNIR